MNDIEKAIQKVKEFGLYHAIQDLPHSSFTVEAFELAIQALQEKLERDNSKPLTFKELLQRDGKPVFYKSLPKWLEVDEECEEFGYWSICRVYDGKHWNADSNGLPWALSKKNYGKLFVAYDYEVKE